VRFLLAPAGTALFAAVAAFIYSSPSPAFCLFLPDSAGFIAFLNVFCLALLFACVTGFVSSWHIFPLVSTVRISTKYAAAEPKWETVSSCKNYFAHREKSGLRSKLLYDCYQIGMSLSSPHHEKGTSETI
jgi:hypothetical protein